MIQLPYNLVHLSHNYHTTIRQLSRSSQTTLTQLWHTPPHVTPSHIVPPQDYGHVGCATNISNVMSSMCSLKTSCLVSVISLHRYSANCPADFKSYLSATYRCEKGESWKLQLQFTTGMLRRCISSAIEDIQLYPDI